MTSDSLDKMLMRELDRCIDLLLRKVQAPPGQREGAMGLRLAITNALIAVADRDATDMLSALDALREWR